MRSRGVVVVSLMIAAAALTRLVGGCAVDDLDIAGKRCPCVGGFTCDLQTDRCVIGGTEASTPIVDAGQPDAPRGAFVILQFRATWRTSRSVRWDWEVAGDASDFAEYQVVIGGSEDAVIRQDSTTTLFDRRINPELGSYGGRDAVSGPTAKAWTVTDRHNTSRRVFAKVVVRDKAGRENASPVVAVETLPENTALVLFADQVVDGASTTPTDLKRVTNDCFSGSAGCLQNAKVDCGDAGSCVLEMGLEGFGSKSVNGMSSAQFDAAFVEVAVRGGSGASAKPHADLILTIGPPSCRIGGNPCRFRFASLWSFRPGAREFRLVQVPLRELLLETPGGTGQALRYEDLNANAMRIDGISIDGTWTADVNIGIDQANVRW